MSTLGIEGEHPRVDGLSLPVDMPVPPDPAVYHILHLDRLASVVTDGHLWCDQVMADRAPVGTTIGMNDIKARRLVSQLVSRPGLTVGQCVPFYFCPRSVMLFLIHRANHPNLTYRGGQVPILHLQSSLNSVVEWAEKIDRRWAFTLSNAGAEYFEDRSDLAQLGEINWDAVQATSWAGSGVDPSVKEGKQAEFLAEHSVPWELVKRIGVRSATIRLQVEHLLASAGHRPPVEVLPAWYY